MRLRPRHYVLIGLILLLGLWNLYRSRRSIAPAATESAHAASPGWVAFDQAAALRDAPETQFTPALATLRAHTEGATGVEAADLRACQMWLMYYRRGAAAASGKSNDWASMAKGHVQSCMTQHRDIGR